MPKTNLSTGSDIRLTYKPVKFLTETSDKVYDFKTYDKAINNLIYKNRQRKIIDKKLWNLDLHQI